LSGRQALRVSCDQIVAQGDFETFPGFALQRGRRGRKLLSPYLYYYLEQRDMYSKISNAADYFM
jgi:hypothetical protein